MPVLRQTVFPDRLAGIAGVTKNISGSTTLKLTLLPEEVSGSPAIRAGRLAD